MIPKQPETPSQAAFFARRKNAEEKEYEEWERELEEQRAENEKRKSMICEYDEIMTEDIFETIVGNCAKRIKRINRN